MKALLYCTKANPRLIKGKHEFYTTNVRKDFITPFQFENTLNGYIVAECDIDNVEEIKPFFCENVEEFKKKTCLTMKELYKYLEIGINEFLFNIATRTKPYGYALHLSNIEVFDKPKELSDYVSLETEEYAYTDWMGYHNVLREKEIKKAPQNMMITYEKNITNTNLNDFPKHKYILISIKPEWLCKILNGEKTIEVRKQILNCLKEMVVDDK